MALYTNRDTGSLAYPPGETTATFNAAPQATAAPSPVDSFLQKLMEALGQEPESGVAPPMGFQNAPLSPFGFATASYNPLTAPLQQQQVQGMFDQRMQAPQLQAQARAKQQGQRIGQLTQAVNAASMLENRRAMAARGIRPGAETMVQVRSADPQTGEPRIEYIPKSVMLERYAAGERFDMVQAVPNAMMQSTEGIAMVPRYGAPTPAPVPSLSGQGIAQPVVPQGVAQGIETLNNLRQKAQSVRNLMNNLASTQGQLKRAGSEALGAIPFVGPRVLSRANPDAEITINAVSDMADMLLRLRSGAQINEAEYIRLRRLLPVIGETMDVANAKLNRFFAELDSIQATKAQLRPGIVAPPTGGDTAPTRRMGNGKVAVQINGTWYVVEE